MVTKQLEAETIMGNWETLLTIIKEYISEPRQTQLLTLFKTLEDRIILMPDTHKPQFNGHYPGGYVSSTIEVVKASLFLLKTWIKCGLKPSFTEEELVFSALTYDLGKIGNMDEPAFIEQTDSWRKDKLGELYQFNQSLEYMSNTDRSLWLLQQNNISLSHNEYLAIKLAHGMYDEHNKQYLTGYLPEQRPRNSMMYILHHAIIMSSRIEFENHK